jgi:hypothetical protein
MLNAWHRSPVKISSGSTSASPTLDLLRSVRRRRATAGSPSAFIQSTIARWRARLSPATLLGALRAVANLLAHSELRAFILELFLGESKPLCSGTSAQRRGRNWVIWCMICQCSTALCPWVRFRTDAIDRGAAAPRLALVARRRGVKNNSSVCAAGHGNEDLE